MWVLPDAGWRGDISSFSVGGDKSSGGSAREATANWTVCDPRAALKNCCHGSWPSSLRARLVYRFTDPIPGWSIVRSKPLFLHLSKVMVHTFQINPKQRLQTRYRLRNLKSKITLPERVSSLRSALTPLTDGNARVFRPNLPAHVSKGESDMTEPPGNTIFPSESGPARPERSPCLVRSPFFRGKRVSFFAGFGCGVAENAPPAG